MIVMLCHFGIKVHTTDEPHSFSHPPTAYIGCEVLKCAATVDAQMSSASKIQADDKDRLLKRKQPRTPTKRGVFQEGGRD